MIRFKILGVTYVIKINFGMSYADQHQAAGVPKLTYNDEEDE